MRKDSDCVRVPGNPLSVLVQVEADFVNMDMNADGILSAAEKRMGPELGAKKMERRARRLSSHEATDNCQGDDMPIADAMADLADTDRFGPTDSRGHCKRLRLAGREKARGQV